MKTLLTYVLAALAATLATEVIELALGRAHATGFGPDSFGRAARSVLMTFVVGGAGWFAVGLAFDRLGRRIQGGWHLVAGALTLSLVYQLFFFALLAVTSIFLIPVIAVFGWEMTAQGLASQSLGDLIRGASLVMLPGSVFAGLAWGGVFWMRAPKLETAGATA